LKYAGPCIDSGVSSVCVGGAMNWPSYSIVSQKYVDYGAPILPLNRGSLYSR